MDNWFFVHKEQRFVNVYLLFYTVKAFDCYLLNRVIGSKVYIIRKEVISPCF